MTEAETAQRMRREVLKLCLWCGSSVDMHDPVLWDPLEVASCWPVGMCRACHDDKCTNR